MWWWWIRIFFEIVPAVGKNRGEMYGLGMGLCGEIVALLPIVVGASEAVNCGMRRSP